MTTDDLKVAGGYLRVTWKPIAGRPASPADILAAVHTLDGVEEVDWCEAHSEPGPCKFSEFDPCSIVSRLVVPIPREET